MTLPAVTSQATSLATVRVCDKAWEYASSGKLDIKSVVLDDGEAAMGCLRLAELERIMVELGSGVNVAMCFDGRLEKALGRKLGKEEVVVIVLCGGSNVGLDMMVKWREEFGLV